MELSRRGFLKSTGMLSVAALSATQSTSLLARLLPVKGVVPEFLVTHVEVRENPNAHGKVLRLMVMHKGKGAAGQIGLDPEAYYKEEMFEEMAYNLITHFEQMRGHVVDSHLDKAVKSIADQIEAKTYLDFERTKLPADSHYYDGPKRVVGFSAVRFNQWRHA